MRDNPDLLLRCFNQKQKFKELENPYKTPVLSSFITTG